MNLIRIFFSFESRKTSWNANTFHIDIASKQTQMQTYHNELDLGFKELKTWNSIKNFENLTRINNFEKNEFNQIFFESRKTSWNANAFHINIASTILKVCVTCLHFYFFSPLSSINIKQKYNRIPENGRKCWKQMKYIS